MTSAPISAGAAMAALLCFLSPSAGVCEVTTLPVSQSASPLADEGCCAPIVVSAESLTVVSAAPADPNSGSSAPAQASIAITAPAPQATYAAPVAGTADAANVAEVAAPAQSIWKRMLTAAMDLATGANAR